MPLQGSAADIMKLAMIKVQENFNQNEEWRMENEGPRMLLQIHDSILVECPEKEAKAVGEILKTTMENAYTKLPVKFKADISIGKNWGEL
jgi:DNA polymerase-1